jgi:hypothetical protein
MKTNKVGLCSKHFEKLAFYVIHHPNKAYHNIANDDNRRKCTICKKKATKLVLTNVSEKVLQAIE